jgi:hypothetical protein
LISIWNSINVDTTFFGYKHQRRGFEVKIKIIILIALFFVCSGFTNKTKTLMDSAVSKTKEQLPMAVDDETLWVDLIANDEGMTYIYKLKTLTVESVDRNILVEIIEENMKNNCNSKFIAIILNEGGTITFIYNDANGNNIITRGYKKEFCSN